MAYEKLRKQDFKKIIKDMKEKLSKTCFYCSSPVKESKRRRDEVICTWKGCKKRHCIWIGTIFYNRLIKKEKILKVLELWMQKASINLISYILGINRETISILLDEIAETIIFNYYKRSEKLGGNDMIVEIDESKFGKIKYHKGHHVEGV